MFRTVTFARSSASSPGSSIRSGRPATNGEAADPLRSTTARTCPARSFGISADGADTVTAIDEGTMTTGPASRPPRPREPLDRGVDRGEVDVDRDVERTRVRDPDVRAVGTGADARGERLGSGRRRGSGRCRGGSPPRSSLRALRSRAPRGGRPRGRPDSRAAACRRSSGRRETSRRFFLAIARRRRSGLDRARPRRRAGRRRRCAASAGPCARRRRRPADRRGA